MVAAAIAVAAAASSSVRPSVLSSSNLYERNQFSI